MCNILYGERGERDAKLFMFASAKNRVQDKRKRRIVVFYVDRVEITAHSLLIATDTPMYVGLYTVLFQNLNA